MKIRLKPAAAEELRSRYPTVPAIMEALNVGQGTAIRVRRRDPVALDTLEAVQEKLGGDLGDLATFAEDDELLILSLQEQLEAEQRKAAHFERLAGHLNARNDELRRAMVLLLEHTRPIGKVTAQQLQDVLELLRG
jgi:ABC-type transporter Mla subunit MlaD